MRERIMASAASGAGLGCSGMTRSTYLAPKAVLDLISASTLLGRYWNGRGSILNVSVDKVPPGPAGMVPIAATTPAFQFAVSP